MFSVSNTQKWNPPAKLDILHPYLYGTNVGGATQTMAQLPFANGTNGKWLTQADVNYLASKNMNCVRLMISQETLQSNLSSNNIPFSDFHPANWAAFKAQIDMLIAANMYIIVARHQGADQYFGQYNGIALDGYGGSNSGSILGDFWRRMVELLGPNNPNIGYSIDNEPLLGSGPGGWWDVAQTCINSIRRAGSGQTIFVPGISYSGSSQWSSVPWNDPNSGGIRNSVGFLQLQDPCDNLVAELHCYFSTEDSGAVTGNVASGTIGRERLANVVAWAAANNKRFFIGEWGSRANIPNANENAADYNQYMRANSSINGGKCVGSAWWVFASYPWFNGYEYTLTPTNSGLTADSAQMDLLESINYFTPVTVAPPFSPSDIPNMLFWYDPANAVTSSGGTLIDSMPNTATSAVSNTTMVSRTDSGWDGKPVYTASDPSFNNKPTISGNSAVTYGSGMRVVNAFASISQPMTWYQVVQKTASTAGSTFYRCNNVMTSAGGIYPTAPTLFAYTGTAASVVANGSPAVNAGSGLGVIVSCVIYDGATSTAYANSLSAFGTGNVGATTGFTTLGMGSQQWNKTFYWKTGEMIGFSGVHDATQRSNMMSWLAAKYGVTIT